MDIFNFSVKRPVAVSVIFIGIVLLGLLYAPKLSIESFPKIEVPLASIITTYPGA